jgi:purine-nucleoside phosphorylase
MPDLPECGNGNRHHSSGMAGAIHVDLRQRLIRDFDVQTLIRIGSCGGGMQPQVKPRCHR